MIPRNGTKIHFQLSWWQIKTNKQTNKQIEETLNLISMTGYCQLQSIHTMDMCFYKVNMSYDNFYSPDHSILANISMHTLSQGGANKNPHLQLTYLIGHPVKETEKEPCCICNICDSRKNGRYL